MVHAISRLTQATAVTLRVEMVDTSGLYGRAEYTDFQVGNAAEK